MRGLRFTEAVEILGKCERTIRRWIGMGVIRHRKVGNTMYLNREDVEGIVKAEEDEDDPGPGVGSGSVRPRS